MTRISLLGSHSILSSTKKGGKSLPESDDGSVSTAATASTVSADSCSTLGVGSGTLDEHIANTNTNEKEQHQGDDEGKEDDEETVERRAAPATLYEIDPPYYPRVTRRSSSGRRSSPARGSASRGENPRGPSPPTHSPRVMEQNYRRLEEERIWLRIKELMATESDDKDNNGPPPPRRSGRSSTGSGGESSGYMARRRRRRRRSLELAVLEENEQEEEGEEEVKSQGSMRSPMEVCPLEPFGGRRSPSLTDQGETDSPYLDGGELSPPGEDFEEEENVVFEEEDEDVMGPYWDDGEEDEDSPPGEDFEEDDDETLAKEEEHEDKNKVEERPTLSLTEVFMWSSPPSSRPSTDYKKPLKVEKRLEQKKPPRVGKKH